MKFHKVTVRLLPALIYGSETRTRPRKDDSAIQASEIKFLKVVRVRAEKKRTESKFGKDEDNDCCQSPSSSPDYFKGKHLEHVQVFKYLGSIIRSHGKINSEINPRISSGLRLVQAVKIEFIDKAEISKKFKMTIFKNTYVPILTCGDETWALTEKHLNSLQAMEMRYLRKVEGKRRRNRIRNTIMRVCLKTIPLKMKLRKHSCDGLDTFRDGRVSVSYTHLDVYKRQVHSFLQY